LLRNGGNAKATAANGVPAITLGIYSKNAEIVAQLLAADPSVANQSYRSTNGPVSVPLLDAISQKQYAAMHALIKAGADVNWSDGTRPTLLEAAIYHNDVEALQALVEGGVAPERVTPRTLLHFAAVQERPEVIRALIGYGVDKNSRDELGISALAVAVDSARFESARALLDAGAWAFPLDAFGESAVTRAKRNIKDPAQSAAMVKLLTSHGAPDNGKNRAVDDRYLHAIQRGDLAGIKAALKDGADVDARLAATPNSPVLHAAALAVGNARILAYLIEQGVSLRAHNPYKFTALHMAAGRGGDLQSIQLLVDHGADANQKTKFGETPLSIAVNLNRPSAVELLLKLGADPNARTAGGGNLLKMARSDQRSTLIAPMLEKAGAQDDPPGAPQPCEINTDPPQACALAFFVRNGNYPKVESAIKRGVNFRERDANGRSLLQVAMLLPTTKEETLLNDEKFFNRLVATKIKTAQLLIDSGIDVGNADKQRLSALHIAAADSRLVDFIGTLIHKGANPNRKGAMTTVFPCSSPSAPTT